MATLVDMLNKGKDLQVEGKWGESAEVLAQAIEVAESDSYPILAELLNYQGINRRMEGEYPNAHSLFVQASFRSKDNEQKSFACSNIADIERVGYRNFASAHVSLDNALAFASHGSLMHAKAADQRGLVFVAQEEYDCAISAYNEAWDICEALLKEPHPNPGDVQNRFAQVVHHHGVAYILQGDPDKVGKAYTSQLQALESFKELGDQQGIVNCVTTLGQIALIRDDPDEAINQYNEAWDILQKTEYKRAIANISLSLAEAHLKKGHNDQAGHYLGAFNQFFMDGSVTEHDKTILKDQFNSVCEMYDSAGMKVSLFEKVREDF